jgi:hypothetical protein
MLTFLCNSVSAVSLSALFFWNQLTVLSEGCLYFIFHYLYTIFNLKLINNTCFKIITVFARIPCTPCKLCTYVSEGQFQEKTKFMVEITTFIL